MQKIIIASFLVIVAGMSFFLTSDLQPTKKATLPVESMVVEEGKMVSEEINLTPPPIPLEKSIAAKEVAKPVKKPTTIQPTQSAPIASPAPNTESKKDESSAALTVPIGQFALKQEWKNAIVNLFCTDSGGNIASGSGVIVDPRGVILTNAHVGESFLFADWPKGNALYDCAVRIGSPAQPRYRAKLVYIPEKFVKDSVASAFKPDDTGYEYGIGDYAILVVMARTNGAALPLAFPSLEASSVSLAAGSYTYILGYPASYLGGDAVQRDLYMLSSGATVHSTGSLGSVSSFVDEVSFLGTVAGQHGTSGGAVVAQGGILAAVPTFYSEVSGATTNDNILSAITIGYIDRDIKKDTGFSLEQFIGRESLSAIADTFLSGDAMKYRCMYVNVWEKKGFGVAGSDADCH